MLNIYTNIQENKNNKLFWGEKNNYDPVIPTPAFSVLQTQREFLSWWC